MTLKKRSPARVGARNRAESPFRNSPATRNGREMEDCAAEGRALNRGGALQYRILQPRDDFQAVNGAALAVLPAVLGRILPGGKIIAGEYIVPNPTREDRHAGSFKINMRSGRWADFATDDRGGDVVSLVSYIQGVRQGEAARLLAKMLGVKTGEAHDV